MKGNGSIIRVLAAFTTLMITCTSPAQLDDTLGNQQYEQLSQRSFFHRLQILTKNFNNSIKASESSIPENLSGTANNDNINLPMESFSSAKNTKQQTTMKTSKTNGTRLLAWSLGLVAVSTAVYFGCTMLPSQQTEAPTTQVSIPRKELVDDIRVLWSFERNFAHHHKRLSSSIEEMGAGYGMGEDGYVLKRSIWEARWEAGSNGVPCEYKIAAPGSQEKKRTGAYRFRVIPILDNTGNDNPFARVLTVFPETSSVNDVCFVALCGPVDLRNDFSFSRAWPVYELRADKAVVETLKTAMSTTEKRISERLSGSGDFAGFVKTTFDGLELPEPEDTAK